MPRSMIDNAACVMRNAALTNSPLPSKFRLSEVQIRRLATEVWPLMQRKGHASADGLTEEQFQDEAVRSARTGDLRLYGINVVLDDHATSATRGAQYRDDQLAGVDNSQQPARGEPRCGGQSGYSQAGDTHHLGNGQLFKPRIRQRHRPWGDQWECVADHRVVTVSTLELAYVVAANMARRRLTTNGGW